MPAQKSEFLRILPALFQFKGDLVKASSAALVGALLFGSGLGLLVPACTLLLGERTSLSLLVREWGRALPSVFDAAANSLAGRMPDEPFSSFLLVMLGICLFQFVSSLARYQYEMISDQILIRITLFWREKLYFHLLSLPIDQLREVGSAQAINQLLSDMMSLAKGYRAILGKTTFKLMRFLAAVSVALLLHWQFTLLALATTPLMFLLILVTGKTIRKSTDLALSRAGDMSGIVQESILGIETLKVHVSDHWHRRRFSRAAREILTHEHRIRRGRSLASAFVEVGNVFALAVTGTVAAWFIFSGRVESAGLVAVMIALVVAFGDLGSITKISQDINQAEAAAQRLARVLNLRPEKTSGKRLPVHHRSLEFEDITFRYPSSTRNAVSEVSFKVEFGELIGIAGRNGAGKSTLIRILCRLITPESGRILLDGADLLSSDLTSLRNQIGLVEQDVKMFRATVAENILLGNSTASPAQIQRAAELARADEFIRKLPKQYDSDLAELGAGLSSGQQQRLAIARALVREPSILLMDEPTSQIDMGSEERIKEVLAALRGKCTVILVAHRTSLLQACDRVLTLDEGRVVDFSPPSPRGLLTNESAPNLVSGM